MEVTVNQPVINGTVLNTSDPQVIQDINNPNSDGYKRIKNATESEVCRIICFSFLRTVLI